MCAISRKHVSTARSTKNSLLANTGGAGDFSPPARCLCIHLRNAAIGRAAGTGGFIADAVSRHYDRGERLLGGIAFPECDRVALARRLTTSENSDDDQAPSGVCSRPAGKKTGSRAATRLPAVPLLLVFSRDGLAVSHAGLRRRRQGTALDDGHLHTLITSARSLDRVEAADWRRITGPIRGLCQFDHLLSGG